MKRYIKIACCNWVNASHDKRELSVARELGAETLVMAKGVPSDKGRIETVDGFTVYRYSVRPFGNASILRAVNRVASVFFWARQARKLRPDIISGHDIIGLLIGYLSTLTMGKDEKPVLVYDSHEYEAGRNYKRSKFHTWLLTRLEKYLMQKCKFTIVVNDSIADALVKDYNLKERPVVARNIANYWTVDSEKNKETRRKLCNKLCIDESSWIMMYHGAVMQGRGIEYSIAALKEVDGAYFVVLGNGTADYINTLKELCKKEGVKSRVLFVPAVSYAELPSYIGAVDLGITTVLAPTKSYYYTLPNKFFEYIQGMTPFICSNFPEFSRIIKKYDIATLINPYNVDELVSAIRELMTNKTLYSRYKENMKKAKEDLCWEKEKVVLEEAYRPLMNIEGGSNNAD